jgi:hypothetical protein
METGLRVCAKVYEELGDKPSKVAQINLIINQIKRLLNIFFWFQWWLCFAKKRFMDKTLIPLGQQI